MKNFRCYKETISIDFDNLTTFIGKNDIGKSTILEALEIFFNNDLVKIDSSDANIFMGIKRLLYLVTFVNYHLNLFLIQEKKLI